MSKRLIALNIAVFGVALCAALGGVFALGIAAPEARAGDGLPVVFAHGLGIPAEAYELMFPLKKLFRGSGHELLIAHTPVAGSLDERADALNREIARLVPSGRFHLVGHSMGGLDARLAIHRYGLGTRVVSLTTLATPHRGSPVADWVLARIGDPSPLVRKLLSLFGEDLKAAEDLTEARMRGQFNAEVTDDPSVRYFSMGFYVPSPVETHSLVPWLWATHAIVSDAGEDANDSMVSVASSRWGEFLGAFPGDHYSETGPVPFIGGPSYLETFGRVISRIDQEAPNP